MAALLLAVLLAGGGGPVNFYSIDTLNLAVFGLAALAFLTGLAGLLVFYNQEKHRLAKEPESPKLRIYRQAPCGVERPLVEDLARFLSASKQQIQEKQWDADWTAYQLHTDAAEKLLGAGNLVAALREN